MAERASRVEAATSPPEITDPHSTLTERDGDAIMRANRAILAAKKITRSRKKRARRFEGRGRRCR